MLTSAVNLIKNLISSQSKREDEINGLKRKCRELEDELEALRHTLNSLMLPMNGPLPSHLSPQYLPRNVDRYGQWPSSGRRDGMQEQVRYAYGASSSYVNAKGSRPFM
jgi:hypothetical protein